MCGTAFTHNHNVKNGNVHDEMRSAQVDRPGTHTAADVQNSIGLMLAQLTHVQINSNRITDGQVLEALFSAVEEARSLVSNIAETFDEAVPVPAEDSKDAQATASSN